MAKVLVNFQDEFLEEIDKIAELEHRTRSSLIREAIRRYLSQYKNETLQSLQQLESISQPTPIIHNKMVFPQAKVS